MNRRDAIEDLGILGLGFLGGVAGSYVKDIIFGKKDSNNVNNKAVETINNFLECIKKKDLDGAFEYISEEQHGHGEARSSEGYYTRENISKVTKEGFNEEVSKAIKKSEQSSMSVDKLVDKFYLNYFIGGVSVKNVSCIEGKKNVNEIRVEIVPNWKGEYFDRRYQIILGEKDGKMKIVNAYGNLLYLVFR